MTDLPDGMVSAKDHLASVEVALLEAQERIAELEHDATFGTKAIVEVHEARVAELEAKHAALVEDHARMKAALEMFRDYTPSEVVMDEFAYKRLVGNMHDSAKRALSPLAKEVQP